LPTIAHFTGAELPKLKIDGLNLSGLLTGTEQHSPRKTLYYYYHRNDLEAVRKGKWKLVLPHVTTQSYRNVLPRNDGWPGPYNKDTTDLALYNLRRDPGEWYDVKEMYPEIVDELMQVVEEARNDLGDQLVEKAGKHVRAPGKIEL